MKNSTVGYTGFHRRIESDNIHGIGYGKVDFEKERSLQRLEKWNKRKIELGLNGIRRLKKRKEGEIGDEKESNNTGVEKKKPAWK